jgi:glycosyltransferase involved in cell wall biosynthesis
VAALAKEVFLAGTMVRDIWAQLKHRANLYLDLRHFARSVSMVESLDFSEQDLAENQELLDAFSRERNLSIGTINWFVPYYEQAYAGIRTIFRFAGHFQNKKKVRNRIIFYDRPQGSLTEIRAKVVASFPGLSDVDVLVLRDANVNALPECDVAMATGWTSAYYVLKFKKTKGKFYLVQDYEPLFYPAGSMYALAEATYRFGFYGIINTPGLCEVYRSRSSAPAKHFVPAVDKEIFYPAAVRPRDGIFRLFFYGRPSVPRNGFEIGISAVKRLKKKWGDKVEVSVAGSPINPGFLRHAGGVRNLGLLPFKQTGDLYRKCDAGLVLMLSKHPSYIPFELMGCGVAVVSNRNPTNGWLFRDGENCLVSEPSVSCIEEKVSALIRDPCLVDKLSKGGLSTVSAYNWEKEIDVVFDFISRQEQS